MGTGQEKPVMYQSEHRPAWELEFLTTSLGHQIRVGDWAQQTAEFPDFIKPAYGQDSSSSGSREPLSRQPRRGSCPSTMC